MANNNNKYTLADFDLVITAPPNAPPLAIHNISLSILKLLQYDGAPFDLADDVLKLETSSPEDAATRGHWCLIAQCIKIQTMASVMKQTEHIGTLQAIIAAHKEKRVYEEWEIAHARAVLAFALFDLDGCVDLGRSALLRTPSDPFTARLLFVTFFLQSRVAEMAETFSALCAHYNSHFDDDKATSAATPQRENKTITSGNGEEVVPLEKAYPYVLVMTAFSLEENGHLVTAREMVYKALSFTKALSAKYPKDGPFRHPFAVHTLMHINESNGDPKFGLEEVNSLDGELWKPTQHLVIHLWWHLALHNYDLGNVEETMRIYREHMLPHISGNDPYSLSDATALLWRLCMDDKDYLLAAGPTTTGGGGGGGGKTPTPKTTTRAAQELAAHVTDVTQKWLTAAGVRPSFHRCANASDDPVHKLFPASYHGEARNQPLLLFNFFQMHFMLQTIMHNVCLMKSNSSDHSYHPAFDVRKGTELLKVAHTKHVVNNYASYLDERNTQDLPNTWPEYQKRIIALQEPAAPWMTFEGGLHPATRMNLCFLNAGTLIFAAAAAAAAASEQEEEGDDTKRSQVSSVAATLLQTTAETLEGMRGCWHYSGGSNAQRSVLGRTALFLRRCAILQQQQQQQEGEQQQQQQQVKKAELVAQCQALSVVYPRNPHYSFMVKKAQETCK